MRHQKTIRISPDRYENTAGIQDAIDQAATGPVRVVLERGKHLCGGLRLRSDVELHLTEGAELNCVPRHDAYSETHVDIIAEGSDRGIIVARDAARIAITGGGRINCFGTQFSAGIDDEMGTRIPLDARPRVLVLDSCTDVEISGITIVNSPMWTLHFVNCVRLGISRVSIDNDQRMPNTDGIVIDSCRDVEIDHCDIRAADDGIVLKTSRRLNGEPVGTCERVRVAHCRVLSRSCALKVGSESFSAFRDLVFEDCEITGSNRGLGIASRDGGDVENVRFSRIAMECEETPNGFWGSGEAFTISVLDRRPHERPAGHVRNVIVEEITGRMEGAVNLFSQHPGGISDVFLRRIEITQEAGALGTGRLLDLRPTPADLEISQQASGRANAWRKDATGAIAGIEAYPGGLPGIFAHNVDNLKTSDIVINRPVPLPDGFNPELIVQSGAVG